jgi:hypothetical protein
MKTQALTYNELVAQLVITNYEAAVKFQKIISRERYNSYEKCCSNDSLDLSGLFVWSEDNGGVSLWSEVHRKFNYELSFSIIRTTLSKRTGIKYFYFNELMALIDDVNKEAVDYIIDNLNVVDNLEVRCKQEKFEVTNLFTWFYQPQGTRFWLRVDEDVAQLLERLKQEQLKMKETRPLVDEKIAPGFDGYNHDDIIVFDEPHRTGGDSRVTLRARDVFIHQMRSKKFLEHLQSLDNLSDPEFDLFSYAVDQFVIVHYAWKRT